MSQPFCVNQLNLTGLIYVRATLPIRSVQGGRKDGRGNEPVGSCAMCDARNTGPRALEGKNR